MTASDLGASVNAFTSTQTSYLFSTTENWRSLIQLIEFVNKPYLTDET